MERLDKKQTAVILNFYNNFLHRIGAPECVRTTIMMKVIKDFGPEEGLSFEEASKLVDEDIEERLHMIRVNELLNHNL